jgi:hypothetical protein
MVEVKIRAVDSSVSFRAVTGSLSGPEPCAVLFEQDRMKPPEAPSAYIKGLALPKSVKNGILGRSVIEEAGSARSSENG